MSAIPFFCCHPQALAYADSHGIALPEDLAVRTQPQTGDRFQLIAEGRLALQPLSLGKVNPVAVDFVGGKLAHRRQFGGGRQQDLAKACGLHQTTALNILDATAGLGQDSFVLASLGAVVHAVEKDVVLHALLQDGWQRGMASDQSEVIDILQRLSLQSTDARSLAGKDLPPDLDVIYLDPMFPPRDKSAKVKANMQALHQWLNSHDSATENNTQLLEWAMSMSPRRVVVKRPRQAPPLADQTPSYQLRGKANRFDIYALRRLTT